MLWELTASLDEMSDVTKDIRFLQSSQHGTIGWSSTLATTRIADVPRSDDIPLQLGRLRTRYWLENLASPSTH